MNTFTLIRMYMVLTFFSVLFVYMNVLLQEQVESGETSKKDFFKSHILLFVSMLLGMLTQYYFIVFAFFVCAFFWILFLLKRKPRHAGIYAAVCASALLSTYGIWPDMIPDMIGGSSAGQVVQNIQTHSDHIGRIRDYIALVNEDLFGGQLKWFLLLLAMTFAAVLVKLRLSASIRKTAAENNGRTIEQDENEEKSRLFGPEFVPVFGITLSCTGFLVFSALTAPFTADRYIFILFPFIMLVVVYLLKNLLKEFQCRKTLTAAFSAVLILMLIMGYIDPGLRNLYHKRAENMTVLSEYKDAPTILVHNGYKTRKKSAELSAYWRNMENDIYITISSNLSELEGHIPDSERLILYLDKDLKDPKGVMKGIKRMSGKKNSTCLGKTSYSKIYVLE